MHRAAETFADAIFPLINFSHQRASRRAKHQRVTVTAIAGHHQIVFVACGQRADNAGFRAIAQVGVAADRAGMLHEGALHALLEFADAAHLRVHPDQPIFAESILCGHSEFLRTSSDYFAGTLSPGWPM